MKQNILAIDYGDKKVGLAIADSSIKIPVPQETITNDQELIQKIVKIIKLNKINLIVIGYPRNQAGEPTAQTKKVEKFTEQLKQEFQDIVFQDESLTSVIAEQILEKKGRPYKREDVDAQAAALILADYLEKI